MQGSLDSLASFVQSVKRDPNEALESAGFSKNYSASQGSGGGSSALRAESAGRPDAIPGLPDAILAAVQDNPKSIADLSVVTKASITQLIDTVDRMREYNLVRVVDGKVAIPAIPQK